MPVHEHHSSLRRQLGLVAAGGALGALARVAIAAAVPAADTGFPWATLGQNVTGTFLLGALLTIVARRRTITSAASSLLGTGTLGAFTTYSALSVELADMLGRGSLGQAAVYIACSLLGGLGAGLLGIRTAQRLTAGESVPERFRP